MSFSFETRCRVPFNIRSVQLRDRTGEVLSRLLNQERVPPIDLEFASIGNDTSASLDELLPNGGLRGYKFRELDGSLNGGYLLYGLQDFWQEFSDIPFYQFSVVELHRERTSIGVAIGLALIVAAASILSADTIIDSTGLLPVDENDHVSVAKLMASATVYERLPINVAVQRLYANLKL